ncbi:MAG: hypothetical protein LBB74_03550 [Chitinispirillales bacterium]|nr:hypothetical protein [Chitinispirillales bacterium]
MHDRLSMAEPGRITGSVGVCGDNFLREVGRYGVDDVRIGGGSGYGCGVADDVRLVAVRPARRMARPTRQFRG